MGNTSLPRKVSRLGWSLAAPLVLFGCNDHPLQALDKVVTSANRQEIGLPAKTKIDFLFLIDNSGSMCEEQENLTRNFSAFSTFLAQDLGSAADYRIAVVNTDLRTQEARGRFQNKPADPNPARNCIDPVTMMAKAPDTQDCQELLDPATGTLPFDIIKSGNAAEGGNIIGDTPAARQADLERKFRCLATLGTNGDGFEKGLEAVRLGLSCDGPNAARFGGCCVDKKYDPTCDIDPGAPTAPAFLRPDAVLVVVMVTDEVDCSDPASNPAAAKKAICKYGPGGGTGPQQPPNGFRDEALCNGESAAQCYARECGNLSAEDCYKQRCVVDRSQNSNCEWFRDRLTPIDDYFDFLASLKLKPREQIVVAAIAGPRAFTESGAEITYNLPERPSNAECDPRRDEYNPDKPLDECCPGGRCEGEIQASCETQNGLAFSGRRYLELVERFGDNGIGCPADHQSTGAACVHICTDDFATPLQEIQRKVAAIIGTYCLDKRPACVVRAAGQDPRACETDAERADVNNYFIELSRGCRSDEIGEECRNALATECGGGNDRCQQGASGTDLRIRFGRDEYTLNPVEPACPSGFELRLRNPPPAGSEVFLEFQVDLAGAPGAAPAAGGAGGAPGGPGGAGAANGAGAAGGAAAPDAGQ